MQVGNLLINRCLKQGWLVGLELDYWLETVSDYIVKLEQYSYFKTKPLHESEMFILLMNEKLIYWALIT